MSSGNKLETLPKASQSREDIAERTIQCDSCVGFSVNPPKPSVKYCRQCHKKLCTVHLQVMICFLPRCFDLFSCSGLLHSRYDLGAPATCHHPVKRCMDLFTSGCCGIASNKQCWLHDMSQLLIRGTRAIVAGCSS